MKENVKNILSFLGCYSFGLNLWYFYLSLSNKVSLTFFNKRIILTKGKNRIVLNGSRKNFGSTGVVIRDFDAFFYTVKSKSNEGYDVVDFSTFFLHQMRSSDELFYSHDIIDPEIVTNIYIEKGQINPGSVVLDLGTYIGTQTVKFSKIVGDLGKVYAFDPDTTSFDVLLKNIELHRCKNIIPLNYGLYDQNGEVGFDSSGMMGSGVNVNSINTIQVHTLEYFVKKYDISKIDFIKMDIEGSEMAVLKSSIEIINRFKPRFIIEPHYVNGILNDNEIVSLFSNINYSVEVVKQGSFDYQPLIYAYPKL